MWDDGRAADLDLAGIDTRSRGIAHDEHVPFSESFATFPPRVLSAYMLSHGVSAWSVHIHTVSSGTSWSL